MVKTIFKEMGGTYREENGYIIPNIILSEKEAQPIGIWGQRHARYLKQDHKVLYMNLLTSGKLNTHFADIDERANDMYISLIKKLAEKENITETLKAQNSLKWIQKMNNIQSRAREIVNQEIIYS